MVLPHDVWQYLDDLLFEAGIDKAQPYRIVDSPKDHREE